MTRRIAAAAGWVLAGTACAWAQEGGEAGIVLGETLFDTFRKGGVLMWPILLCSVVGFAFVLERLVALRSGAVFPRRFLRSVRGMLEEGQTDAALQACRENRSPFARLLRACLERAGAGDADTAAALEEAGSRVLYDLRRNTRPLGVIADVAPLLGLMGTVVGMIKAFEVVASSGALGRTELLAEGIGEALITTAFGLSVAIPAVMLHQYFRGKAEGLTRAMEDACLELLSTVQGRGTGS